MFDFSAVTEMLKFVIYNILFTTDNMIHER